MGKPVVIARFWQKERTSKRQVDQLHGYIFDLGIAGATHVDVRFDRQDLVDLVDNLEKLNKQSPTPASTFVEELGERKEVRLAKASWAEERGRLLSQVELAQTALEILERMRSLDEESTNN